MDNENGSSILVTLLLIVVFVITLPIGILAELLKLQK